MDCRGKERITFQNDKINDFLRKDLQTSQPDGSQAGVTLFEDYPLYF